LDSYLLEIEYHLKSMCLVTQSTTFKSNIELFFNSVKTSTSTGAYKLTEVFKTKQVTPQTLTYFFGSFIVVGNKMYFYVMPTTMKNRGSQVIISKKALTNSFLGHTSLKADFEPTKDLTSTELIIDVQTVIISAEDPVPLINYLAVTGKTYAYSLYRFWSMIFPTMHKGIDVDEFIKFISKKDKLQLHEFFFQWTFTDDNQWLGDNHVLTENKSLFIKQFMVPEDKITNKDELTSVQKHTSLILKSAMQEIKNWSNVKWKLNIPYQMIINGFAVINSQNKPVISVMSSQKFIPLHLLIQFVATMDYFYESNAVGYKVLSAEINCKYLATKSLLDISDVKTNLPINSLPLNIKYFFPKELWENKKDFDFFKDNVMTNLDWFLLMVAYYKGYSIVSIINAMRYQDITKLRRVHYRTLEDFKSSINEWLTTYKKRLLVKLHNSLMDDNSSSSIDKEKILNNLEMVNYNLYDFFAKMDNSPKEEDNEDICKNPHPWVNIEENGIKIQIQKIVEDTGKTEKEVKQWLKDKKWYDKQRPKLLKEFGQTSEPITSLSDNLITRLTIILFNQ